MFEVLYDFAFVVHHN